MIEMSGERQDQLLEAKNEIITFFGQVLEHFPQIRSWVLNYSTEICKGTENQFAFYTNVKALAISLESVVKQVKLRLILQLFSQK